MTATGSAHSLSNCTYLVKSITWTLPTPKWASATTALSGSLFALCPKSGFLCCGDSHIQLSIPDPSCPRALVPLPCLPFVLQPEGNYLHHKHKTRTPPCRQQPAQDIGSTGQCPEGSSLALHPSGTARPPHVAIEGLLSFTAWNMQDIAAKWIPTLPFSHSLLRVNCDISQWAGLFISHC